MSALSQSALTIPPLDQVLAVALLRAGFNTALVVIGTTCLGVAAGVIGTFALLRKRSLMADALAHSALPGLGIAFLVGSSLGIGGKSLPLLLAGAAASGMLGIVVVQAISRYTRLGEDCAIGAVLSVFFGFGVVLMSIIQGSGSGEEGGLHHFIYGQTAAMTRGDAMLTLICALATISICIAALKEFRLVCFDRQFAAATGWPITTLDIVMMSLVAIVTVVGLQAVGILLIVALLVIPPAGARFWTNRTTAMVALSGVIGGCSGYIGSVTSAILPGVPVGAVIVLVASIIFLGSMLCAPTRGLLSATAIHLRMRVRIAQDHLLRSIYEHGEQTSTGENPRPFVGTKSIPLIRQWHPLTRWLFLRWCQNRHWIEIRRAVGDKELRLTTRGFEQAGRRVRNHRLWEEYLALFADVPVSHVDYSADLVEHALSPNIVAQLEESLAARKGAEWLLHKHRSLHPLGDDSHE